MSLGVKQHKVHGAPRFGCTGGAAYAIAARGDEAVCGSDLSKDGTAACVDGGMEMASVTEAAANAIPPFHKKMARTGMTLIEIMIVVSLLAGVMAISWGSFSVAADSQERMQEINERLHGVEQAVNKMVRDISTAFITKHGDDDSQTEIRYKTGFLGDENRVDFTSMGYVRMFRNEKVGDQSEISYFIKDMKNEEGDWETYLVRREQAPINDDFTRGGTILPLLDHVLSFRLQYWDDEKAEMAVGNDGWVDSWDTEHSDYKGRLPSRIKIEIEIDDPLGGDDPMLITTQAQIHLTKALEF
ncbi:MAG: prepilin-type N-terminal cleavage/methylation domain-containing protein [Proteobacteria bacterium]|nr:prepilin-type N-terminal cleavage/methylation domain-containing protein [Pseudomonadota bacterium]